MRSRGWSVGLRRRKYTTRECLRMMRRRGRFMRLMASRAPALTRLMTRRRGRGRATSSFVLTGGLAVRKWVRRGGVPLWRLGREVEGWRESRPRAILFLP